MLKVPVLWGRFVTRADRSVAREIMVGPEKDVLAHDDRFWSLIEHPRRLTFTEAVERALLRERKTERPHGAWGAIELVRGAS